MLTVVNSILMDRVWAQPPHIHAGWDSNTWQQVEGALY